MKKLLLIILLIVGCGMHLPYEWTAPFSECPDPKAMNFNIYDCSLNSSDYDPSECPWETNEDCEYCEDDYETEEERLANCCYISGAKNYVGYWGDYVWSRDSTYCVF